MQVSAWTQQAITQAFKQSHARAHDFDPMPLQRTAGAQSARLFPAYLDPQATKHVGMQAGRHLCMHARIESLALPASQAPKANQSTLHDQLQAADDAGASEVAFMLDENSYPTDSILGTIMLSPGSNLVKCALRLLQRLLAPRLSRLQLRAQVLLPESVRLGRWRQSWSTYTAAPTPVT